MEDLLVLHIVLLAPPSAFQEINLLLEQLLLDGVLLQCKLPSALFSPEALLGSRQTTC